MGGRKFVLVKHLCKNKKYKIELIWPIRLLAVDRISSIKFGQIFSYFFNNLLLRCCFKAKILFTDKQLEAL